MSFKIKMLLYLIDFIVRVKEHCSSLWPFGMQGENARGTTTFWDGATSAYLALQKKFWLYPARSTFWLDARGK
jgi:hypothetical protein